LTRLVRPLVFAAALAATACLGTDRGPSTATEKPPSTRGEARAPDFELRSLDGTNVRLGDHFGKDVVLVDFWATYCQPCLLALPHLDELYRKYKSKGFVVLAVSIDEAALGSRVRVEAAKLRLSFPVLLDTETDVVARYNPRSTAPYSVLVGRDGRILARREGYTVSERQALEDEVKRALGL
jgi:cytochrome c biogenesis protein CcmG/thiol:disulfide interchange protein DsbE